MGEGWVAEEFPTILSCISSGPRRSMGTDPVSQSVLRNIPCGDKRGETVLFAGQVLPRPGLFKRWIVLSTGLIAIQRISIKYHLCYPVFSRLTRGVWGSRTLRACLRAWDSNAILRMLRLWKKKKQTKTTVLQSSSVLYSECIGPQLNFQVEKKSKLLYTGSCLFNEIYFIKLTALQALDIGFIFT